MAGRQRPALNHPLTLLRQAQDEALSREGRGYSYIKTSSNFSGGGYSWSADPRGRLAKCVVGAVDCSAEVEKLARQVACLILGR